MAAARLVRKDPSRAASGDGDTQCSPSKHDSSNCRTSQALVRVQPGRSYSHVGRCRPLRPGFLLLFDRLHGSAWGAIRQPRSTPLRPPRPPRRNVAIENTMKFKKRHNRCQHGSPPRRDWHQAKPRRRPTRESGIRSKLSGKMELLMLITYGASWGSVD